MSWTDTILSNTVGVAYRAYTGNVDPWTLQGIKDDAHDANVQALGGNDTSTYGEVDPGKLAIANAQTDASIDANLISQNAHPSQSTGLPRIHIPLLGDLTDTASYLKAAQHVVYALLAIGAVGATGYFLLKYRHTLKERLK